MTESDMKEIYEWAYPELKSKDWALSPAVDRKGNSVAPVAIYEDATGRTFGKPLRPLDHNCAFDVCVPKLRSAGVFVEYHSHLTWSWKCIAGTLDWREESFYSALLAYIRGAKCDK